MTMEESPFWSHLQTHNRVNSVLQVAQEEYLVMHNASA
jgi:hypothetical protein